MRALALLVLSLVAACGGSDLTEARRILSPDGTLEAVVLDNRKVPLSGMMYWVRIVPNGVATTRSDTVFSADHAVAENGSEGIDVKWLENRVLEIRFANAAVIEFRGVWRWEDDAAEVRLKPLRDRWVAELE